MGNTTGTIRELARSERSTHDKGWVLDIQIIAYDNGMLNVNGMPTGVQSGNRWLSASRLLTQMLEELEEKSRNPGVSHV